MMCVSSTSEHPTEVSYHPGHEGGISLDRMRETHPQWWQEKELAVV